MSGAPITLTLYDKETNEAKKTYTRSFVPWRLMKRAAKLLTGGFNLEDINEDTVNQFSGLVIDIFGDQFTLEELEDGADLGEMITVLETIMKKVSGGLTESNPTTQA